MHCSEDRCSTRPGAHLQYRQCSVGSTIQVALHRGEAVPYIVEDHIGSLGGIYAMGFFPSHMNY